MNGKKKAGMQPSPSPVFAFTKYLSAKAIYAYTLVTVING